MATAQTERVDPKTRRISPQDVGNLRFGNKDRKYMLANPNDDLFGLQMHLDSGWEKVNGQSEKERVIGGRVEANGFVTFQGQVLIWLPLEEWLVREGIKRERNKAREAKRRAPGGEFGVRDAEGNPAQDAKEA